MVITNNSSYCKTFLHPKAIKEILERRAKDPSDGTKNVNSWRQQHVCVDRCTIFGLARLDAIELIPEHKIFRWTSFVNEAAKNPFWPYLF